MRSLFLSFALLTLSLKAAAYGPTFSMGSPISAYSAQLSPQSFMPMPQNQCGGATFMIPQPPLGNCPYASYYPRPLYQPSPYFNFGGNFSLRFGTGMLPVGYFWGEYLRKAYGSGERSCRVCTSYTPGRREPLFTERRPEPPPAVPTATATPVPTQIVPVPLKPPAVEDRPTYPPPPIESKPPPPVSISPPTVNPDRPDLTEPEVDESLKDNCDNFRNAQLRSEGGVNCPLCGPEQVKQNTNPTRFTTTEPADAARRMMATIYQSCQVVRINNVVCPGDSVKGYDGTGGKFSVRTVRDRNEILKSHPYLKQITNGKPEEYCQENHPACNHICERPPVFRIGGKVKFVGQELDVTGHKAQEVKGADGKTTKVYKQEPGVSGLDCSGFVTGALHVAGMRIKKNSSSNIMSTHDLLALGNPATDCLLPATMKEGLSLISGDVIVWKDHTLMIESAGEDPLGVQAIINSQATMPKPENCETLMRDNFDPAKMDFTIIMSATMQSGIGVMRARARDYFPASDRFYAEWLRRISVKACRAQLSAGQPNATEKATVDAEGNRAFAVLRHVNQSNPTPRDPKCNFPSKPKIKCEGAGCEVSK